MRYELAGFDLDGTLVNTQRLYSRVLTRLGEKKVEEITPELYLRLQNHDKRELSRAEKFLKKRLKGLELRKEMLDIIKTLYENNVKIGIASYTRRTEYVKTLLEKAGIQDIVGDKITTFENNFGGNKWLALSRLTGVPLERTVGIEDSLYGGERAREVGVGRLYFVLGGAGGYKDLTNYTVNNNYGVLVDTYTQLQTNLLHDFQLLPQLRTV